MDPKKNNPDKDEKQDDSSDFNEPTNDPDFDEFDTNDDDFDDPDDFLWSEGY